MGKIKSKKRKRSSSASSSSSSSSTSSSESSIEKRKLKKLKKKLRKEKRKTEKALKKKLKKEKHRLERKHRSRSKSHSESSHQAEPSNDIPIELMEKSKAMAPMTKEEWEKRQSVIRRVIDEETGRQRLIKGDGEILEEIVSRDRHKQINKLATQADGDFFQAHTAGKTRRL